MTPETRPVTSHAEAKRARWAGAAAWLRRPRRADLVGCFVLLLVTCAVIFKAAHWDAWIARTDLLTAYIPFYSLLGEQLRDFTLPGWSPYQASGLPLAGDPQSGWMYFPAMLFYTLLPPIAATKAVMAFQLLVAAFSTYLFARLLGMRVVASLVAAISFALGANVHHNTYCCTIWSQSATWIPLGLVGIELGVRPGPLRYRAGGWAIAGIAISQMFAGWLGQGIYSGLLILGAYTLYRTLISPPGARATLGQRAKTLAVAGGAIAVLSLGLAAAGLLPRLDANQSSQLAGGYAEVTEDDDQDRGWVPRYMLFQIFDTDTEVLGVPFLQESNRRLYVGGVTASLAMVALFIARRRFATPFFTIVAAIMLVMTTKETALHRLFYQLPQFESLHEHTPFRLLGLFFIMPAMLAAAAVDSIDSWARKRWLFPVALVPLLVAIWIDDIVQTRTRHVGQPAINAAVIVTIILIIAAAIGFNERLKGEPRADRLFQGLRILILIALLWEPTGRQLIEPGITSEQMPPAIAATVERALADTDPGGAGEFLQHQLDASGEPFRYYGYDGARLRTLNSEGGQTYHGRVTFPEIQSLLVSARATRLGLYDIQGYNPSQSQLYADYLQAANQGVAQNYHDANVLHSGIGSPLIDLLNVRYIVVPSTVPPGRPDLLRLSQLYPTVFDNGQVRVLENGAALPHAWIVHETRVASPEETLTFLEQGSVDPRSTALVGEAIPAIAPVSGDDAVTFTQYGANEIELTTQTGSTGLLIVNEIDAPGWHAYVDGDREDIHRVNALQRGIVVPAGTHRVELVYEPLSLRAGIAISAISAFFILIIGICILIPLTPFGRRWLASWGQPERPNE